MGSSPIAHATATIKNPMNQALIGMLGTFIDTIIVCSMTGFVILVTGQWTSGLQGVAITSAAFEQTLPGFGGILVTLALTVFAFTTILGWCVYSERCIIYLLGDKIQKPFRILFTIVVPIGAVSQMNTVWLLADIFNAFMAIPNLIGVLLLSPVIFKLVKEYYEKDPRDLT